jgi:putative transcriptional regulator
MAQNQVSLTDLATRVGITLANLSIIKTNKARAIRFTTLAALCRELKCQPGDLLEFGGEQEAGMEQATGVYEVPSSRQAARRQDKSSSGLPGDYY